jgi:hypothetical protein
MKKPKFSSILIGLALFALVVACFACIARLFRRNEPSHGCRPLPEDFSENDLVGTWLATSIDISDTLVIRADHTYKQIIYIGISSFDYESDWQPWRFEYRANGTGYLHMEGLRICAANNEVSCDWINDGKRPYSDPCVGQYVEPLPAAGEIILVVTGNQFPLWSNKAPYPIILRLFKGFESSAWGYFYQGL